MNREEFINELKEHVKVVKRDICKKKKIRTTIYVVCVLWIAVLSQHFVNRWYVDDSKLVDAFTKTNSVIISSNLYMVADIGSDYFSEEDEKNLLQFISSEIGLVKDCKITKEKDVNAITTKNKSDQAETIIKLLRNKEGKADGTNQIRRYITVDLTIYGDVDSILSYKKRAEKIALKIDSREYESQVTFTGTYNGKLDAAQKDKITDQFMRNLQANVVVQNKEEELYTVYGYTGLIGDYIKSEGKKINVNLAFTYDEEQNKTKLYVATPILNQDY